MAAPRSTEKREGFMESSIESARPPARPQAAVAAWAQSVEQAIASQQWHGAWRALIDAALPAETAVQQSLLTALDAWDGLAADSGDRKSTRLNSSHLVISYAVFCLK